MKNENELLLIPQSLALKMFNQLMGTRCVTLAETREYLDQHPDEAAQMESRILEMLEKREPRTRERPNAQGVNSKDNKFSKEGDPPSGLGL